MRRLTRKRGLGGARSVEEHVRRQQTMTLRLARVNYCDLNARQKENYNFLKVSAVLADYGFVTRRLSDDWQGADFIAQHVNGETFLKVQLKSRLSFAEKYRGKNLYIAFCSGEDCYLFPHDELLDRVLAETNVGTTVSWLEQRGYSFPELSRQMQKMLAPYSIR